MAEEFSILLIEDETEIVELITRVLLSDGIKITSLTDGQEALNYIQETSLKNIDLVIIDRMLPRVNGMEICQFIRLFNQTKNKPILFLTALSSPEEIIEGLESGADDYITKPFDTNVLKARIKSMQMSIKRRALEQNQIGNSQQQQPQKILSHKNLKVDLDQCQVKIGETPLELTLSEYKLLVTFMENPGKVLTRNHLIQSIQEGPVHVTDRTIDTHVFGLRKKLGELANIIETVRGVGYRVVPI